MFTAMSVAAQDRSENEQKIKEFGGVTTGNVCPRSFVKFSSEVMSATLTPSPKPASLSGQACQRIRPLGI